MTERVLMLLFPILCTSVEIETLKSNCVMPLTKGNVIIFKNHLDIRGDCVILL